MNGTQGFAAGFGVAALLAAGAAGAWRAGGTKGIEHVKGLPPPANVAKKLDEGQIQTIVLRPEALDRLALKTGAVETKAMPRFRIYGGEIVIPTGHSVIVSAPLNGTLRAMPQGMPSPGSEVKKGEPLLQLLPLLTPEGRVTLAATKIDSDGQVKTTQTQLEAAQIAFDRASRLFKSDAGSKKAVDDAQAQLDFAKKSYEAAVGRSELLARALGEADKGTASPLTLESPDNGIVRNVSAVPGQYVPAGAVLFEVADVGKVWVRVPVYVGDLADLDGSSAAVGSLIGRPGDATTKASAAAAPPSANPATGTVDLFFDLDNRTHKYRPGQRVGASLALRGEREGRTIAWSAVIHDFYGGTWVYVETGERTYVRQRVEVRNVADGVAVLSQGPPVGAKVVVAGAAELFGAETGFTK